MFTKLSTAVAAFGLASAYETTTPFLRQEFESPEKLGTISTGTYPCMFRIDDSWYDYTPFKLAFSAPEAFIATGEVYEVDKYKTVIFGWCQQLSDIQDDASHPPVAC